MPGEHAWGGALLLWRLLAACAGGCEGSFQKLELDAGTHHTRVYACDARFVAGRGGHVCGASYDVICGPHRPSTAADG